MHHDADYHAAADRVAANIQDRSTRSLRLLKRHLMRCEAGEDEKSPALFAVLRELSFREDGMRRQPDWTSEDDHVLLSVERLSLNPAGKPVKFT